MSRIDIIGQNGNDGEHYNMTDTKPRLPLIGDCYELFGKVYVWTDDKEWVETLEDELDIPNGFNKLDWTYPEVGDWKEWEGEPHIYNGEYWIKESNMELTELIAAIKGWANDRNIIEGSNPQAQYVKLIEEAGELAGNIARGRDVKDDIGDMIVVLTIIAAQHKLSIAECVAEAWDDIKDRKGKMIDGVFVKEADL